MKPQDILQTLKTLDPENKEHWNQDGQPRLGAVGENVTRAEIQAVAPMFRRDSLELPEVEAEPTIQEVAEELAEQFTDYQILKNQAIEKIRQAELVKQAADKALEQAKAAYEKIRDEEKALDTRSDTEINMAYLQGAAKERQDRYDRAHKLNQILHSTDLAGAVVSISTESKLDKSIAAINKRARRQAR